MVNYFTSPKRKILARDQIGRTQQFVRQRIRLKFFSKPDNAVYLVFQMKFLSYFLAGCTAVCSCCYSHFASAQGAAYSKIEAAFNITGISTDPAVLFDYLQTDVSVSILQPDSTTATLPAFYDGGTTWRVRHTPTQPGNYQISGITLNGSPISVSNLQPTNWVVTGFPTSAGFVSVDPNNPRRFITSNGRRYYPVGEDVAWDVGAHTVTAIFPKLGAAHGNWARVWMDQWDGKNLDWNNNGSSPGPLGVLNLTVAQKWDSIVAAADQAGIHLQMTLQHHGQYSTTTDANWSTNPYNVANGSSTIGFLSSPVDFFTDATAKAVTKLKIRYAIARWGYSPGIMAWELFNEVQFTDAASSGQWSLVQAWHNEMAQFIRSQDPYQHLITSSSVLNEPIWDQTDYYQHHDYPSDLITGLRDAQDISGSQPVAPDFSGECGTNGAAPHYGLNAPMWAGLMAGQSGNAQPWYWDGTDAANDYPYFQAVSDFVTRSGLGDQDVLTKSAPRTTGGPIGSLVFAPGGGWGPNLGPDTFTVGGAAPNGIGLSTAYLQGNGNRALLPNGYTFLVNYPSSGTFQVQIKQRAAAGCTLQLFVDSVLVTNRAWAGTGSDVSSNINTRINISTGPHTIQLANPGPDWALLGNITLNPYVAQLGAYAVGNANFQAIWLWHRTNVFAVNAGPAVTGTVDVLGLNPGTYAATWWDTFGAGAISNFTFTVADPGIAVTLTPPPVLRSMAFYAGTPAQAGVLPPNLTQTVAPSSPSFILPLTITNSGGLPLGYSLSFTSAIPAWLSFSLTNGYVSKSGAVTVFLAFNPTGLAVGTYHFTIFVNTGDPLLPVTVLPVSLTISSGAPAAPQLLAVSGSGGQFIFQLQGDTAVPYIVQSSTDLVSWVAVSTNTLPGGVLNITNPIPPGSAQQFWRSLWQP